MICGNLLGMNIRDLPHLVGTALLGASYKIDQASVDLEAAKGSSATVWAMRAGSVTATALAVPMIVFDFLAGGPRRRPQPDVWTAATAADRDFTDPAMRHTCSKIKDPVWHEFVHGH